MIYASFVDEDVRVAEALVRHRTANIFPGFGPVAAVSDRASVRTGKIITTDEAIYAREDLHLVAEALGRVGAVAVHEEYVTLNPLEMLQIGHDINLTEPVAPFAPHAVDALAELSRAGLASYKIWRVVAEAAGSGRVCPVPPTPFWAANLHSPDSGFRMVWCWSLAKFAINLA